jgi:hypothetical protein
LREEIRINNKTEVEREYRKKESEDEERDRSPLS